MNTVKNNLQTDELFQEDGVYLKVLQEIMKIAHQKKRDHFPITPVTHVALELGLDSIDMLELTAFLDKTFEIHLSQEEIIKAHTVQDIVQKVNSALKENTLESLRAISIEERELSEEEKQEIKKNWDAFSKREGFKQWCSSSMASLIRAISSVYLPVTVKGTLHLPKKGSFILCANHSSHLDNLSLILACERLHDQFVFMAAQDYFFGKSLKTNILTTLFNLVPFDRSGSFLSMRKNIAYLEQAKQAGQIIVLFPEGTRSMTGELNEFKPGVALFADSLNLEVVPTYIQGTYASLPKGRALPKPGKITVTFGPPMKIENPIQDPEDPQRYHIYHEFMEKLRNAILSLKDGK